MFPQKTSSGCQKRRGKEKASHKEASECIHVVHEGNESKSGSGMHAERECGNQSDPWPKGEHLKPMRLYKSAGERASD